MVRGEACRRRRGSYFFVLDAFIATMILIFTIVLAFGLFVSPEPSTQSTAWMNDYISFLSNTQLRDLSSGLVAELYAEGNITDLHNTIAMQLLLFHNQSRDDLAWNLTEDTVMIIPEKAVINVSITDENGTTVVYSRWVAGAENRKTHIAVNSIEYVVLDDGLLYGPVLLTVEAWS